MRTITLAAVLLCLAVATFAASSPEIAVGGTATVNAPYGRWYPSVDSNGDGFFAVWIDQRAYAFDSIVGARISASGEVLDRHGIILGVGGNVEPPQVVWDGSAWQVIWTHTPFTSAGRQRSRIMGARVAPDGRIVTPTRVLKEGAFTGKSSFAASNGTVTVIGYVVDTGVSFGDVQALVLDRHGNPVYFQRIADDTTHRQDVTVATTGSDFVLAWAAYPANEPLVEITSLNRYGEPLAREVRVIGDGGSPRIASNGDYQYVIVAQRTVGTPAWVSRIVTADLGVSPTCVLSTDATLDDPTVMFRNGQYDFIAWKPKTALVATRLDLAGCAAAGLHELTAIATELPNVFPSAATNGRDVLAVWTAYRETADVGTFDIFARVHRGDSRLVPAGEPVHLARSGNSQRAPSIASSGSNQLVAWLEPDYSIWATRLGPGGEPLDGRGIRLSTSRVWDRPRVAFDGRFYVVGWTQLGHIVLRWIDPATGAVVAQRTMSEANGGSIALAATPQATFLAWVDEMDDVRLTRISNETHQIEASLRVSPDMDARYTDATLSWNGSTLLVAWTEFEVSRGDPPFWYRLQVLGARVTPQLTLLDPAPLLIGDVPGSFENPPSVASNGKDWLVVWQSGANVAARRVLHDGRLEGSAAEVLTTGLLPAVAFDGTRYTLVWQDLFHNSTNYGQRALRLGSAASEGVLGVSTGSSIALIDTYPSFPPSLARAADGRMAVVYTRTSFVPEHGGVERAFLRFMDVSGARRMRVVR